MISCLMVTRPGKEQDCRESIRCFARQRFVPKELVIVHDGGAVFQQWLESQAGLYPNTMIQVEQCAPASLGMLRNRTLMLARFPYVCQWDDDDLSHPDRLQLQFEFMQSEGADFCFLTDQLHLFSHEGYLFWDDWSANSWPGNLIQGTMMARRDLVGAYADLPRGEDTELLNRLVHNSARICSLSDFGWMYVYIFNGRNAWDISHHKAISRWKRMNFERLQRKLPLLRDKLQDYELPFDSLSLPHEQGKLLIPIQPAQQRPIRR